MNLTIGDTLCPSCCSHGGICTLPLGHEGKHDASGQCQWTDEEAVSREESDAAFMRQSPLMAAVLLPIQEACEASPLEVGNDA